MKVRLLIYRNADHGPTEQILIRDENVQSAGYRMEHGLKMNPLKTGF